MYTVSGPAARLHLVGVQPPELQLFFEQRAAHICGVVELSCPRNKMKRLKYNPGLFKKKMNSYQASLLHHSNCRFSSGEVVVKRVPSYLFNIKISGKQVTGHVMVSGHRRLWTPSIPKASSVHSLPLRTLR